MPFLYQPLVGPLSGVSFEEQTVAFLNSIEADYTLRISNLKSYVDSKLVDMGGIQGSIEELQASVAELQNNITTIRSDITGLRNKIDANTAQIAINTQDITTINGELTLHDGRITKLEEQIGEVGGDITAIETRLDAMQLEINTATAGVVQTGTIVLFNTTPPTGYTVCNGSGDTPDLSAYTTPPLAYARKG